jgi:hypothetical protein
VRPSLAFVVPVHGRLELAAICLRQLRRTCDELIERGIDARAIVVSDADTIENHIDPLELGFATVRRDNAFTSRRFNDGIQLACDPRFNDSPVDYVVPCGSDDWVDHRLFLEPLPAQNTLQGFKWASFVSEDGKEICATHLNYEGGAGIRIIPRELVAPLGYRPADEDRRRGCDTSILTNLRRHHGDRLKVKHYDTSPYWIVDWKTHGTQLNPYENVTAFRRSEVRGDPFKELAGFYPDDALEEMEQLYLGVPA